MDYKAVATFVHPIVPIDLKAFESIGINLIQKQCHNESEVISLAQDADIVIANLEPVTRKVVENLKKCRLIYVPHAGYDNVDVVAATEHGIYVANVQSTIHEEVSDHAMALILACARKLLRLNKAVREGKWTGFASDALREIWFPIHRLRGQTLGVIGLGKIGRALVPKAKGFGMKVIAYDPYVPAASAKDLGIEMVDLNRVLVESDYVSIHAALTPESRHMMGIEQFQKMKPSAYLINTARGPFVDHQALYVALSNGYIAGAALDVTEPEPINVDNSLLKLDNVIVTAHSAGISNEVLDELRPLYVQEIKRFMDGQMPVGLVNPKAKEAAVKRFGG